MALTRREENTYDAIQDACRKYSNRPKIDWEQREWELFKLLLDHNLTDESIVTKQQAARYAAVVAHKFIRVYRDCSTNRFSDDTPSL